MIGRTQKSWLVAIFFVLILVSPAVAQDYKKQYRQAKDLFAAANYPAAMDAFNALTVYDSQNPYTQYASFYYALSAQRLGYLSVAKDSFLQLKKLYPAWGQMDEVNFWLSKIYFEQGEYFQALLLASQIKDKKEFTSELNDLRRLHFSKIQDTETLRMILEDYPDDVEAARALVKIIGGQPYHEQDTHLLDSLIDRFNLPRKLITVEVPKPIFKDSYRVALVLPFLASTLDPSPVKKRNQFVLDLYEGMKMAADTLAKAGIKLDLVAYDNERSLDATNRVLKEEEMKSADLLVGPLFTEESKPVLEYALANQISVVINPVSNNSDFTIENPFAFLYQPSYETLGIRSAEQAAKARRKNCIVYYSDSPKDSVMAFNFIKRATELGVKIVFTEELKKETTGNILTKLTTATEHDEWKNPTQFALKKDSIGSIFVASNNELIYSKVVNSVETRGDSILVIGNESWLEDTSIDLGKFERTGVVLAAPNYKVITSPAYIAFRKKYLARHGNLPSEYALTGYEFLVITGQLMHKYGANFLQTMKPGETVPGILTAGFMLEPTRDNGTVPFISLRKGKLVRLDTPKP